MSEPIVDKTKCSRCGGNCKSAHFYNAGVQLAPDDQPFGLMVATAPCDAWVCMKCGHVEIFARSLEAFYEM